MQQTRLGAGVHFLPLAPTPTRAVDSMQTSLTDDGVLLLSIG